MRLLLMLLSGCALLSKSPPVAIRYFSPEATAPAPATAIARSGPTLRLGHIRPAALLRTRIVHRASPVEVAEYDTLRWTEEPDAYVRRALSRALFETGRFAQVVGGSAPTLDIEIVAFEETPSGGRVQLHYQLTDDRQVLARGDVVCERPAAGAGIDAAVSAIGAALTAASEQLASNVAVTLHAG